jgi:hypothetical protein
MGAQGLVVAARCLIAARAASARNADRLMPRADAASSVRWSNAPPRAPGRASVPERRIHFGRRARDRASSAHWLA